jgi:glycerate kinase
VPQENRVHILIAPDKFKGCLTASDVAQALMRGLRRNRPRAEFDLCPLADGGEGTVAALVAATKGKLIKHTVTGPLPEMKVEATFGMLGDGETAVIEMAEASGLHLLGKDQYNPLATTTFGTGELMKRAAELHASKLILGIGGSATTDAGIGCAQAAGLPVLLKDGEPTSPTEPLCGRDMDRVVLIKHGRGSPVDSLEDITVACDVTNPLFGPNGAAYVFGPQKGATPEMCRQLDDMLKGLAARLNLLHVANEPGTGAAGGLGFGLRAYFNAKLQSGFKIVAAAANLRDRIARADLVITGEGKLDESSLAGKTAHGVAVMCKELGKPCVAVAGVVEASPDLFRSTHAISKLAKSPEDSFTRAKELLEKVAVDIR